MAWLVRAGGVADIASAVTHADRSRLGQLTQVLPHQVSDVAAAAAAVTGVLLLLLGHGLRRRKRRAWAGAVALLALSVVLHVVKGLDYEEAAGATALLVVLIADRAQFRAESDPRGRWLALSTGAALLLGSVAVGLALVRLRAPDAGPGQPFTAQLAHVLLGLVGASGPLTFDSDRDADVVQFTLLALGGLTVLTTVYLALRPAEPLARLTPDDECQLRELLGRQGGRDSLGYFALRTDKTVLWSTSRKAAIAYRVLSGVVLASGDPLGDPEAWPGAIHEFLALADRHAWAPAVIGCSEDAATAYARAGLSVLEIGDEAVLPVDEFTLEGRKMRGVRQAVARAERAGYTSTIRRGGAMTEAERATVRHAGDAWLGTDTERGFSMALGRLADDADPECVVVTAEKDGAVRALLQFVPWGPDGLSLDVMRRDRSADNGVNEFLIARTLEAAAELGVRRVSLNFAVFRSALERGERLGAGPIVRSGRRLLHLASRWFQIESLWRFNEKFRPVWQPRYLCFPSMTDLPRVALAALEAEAFLTWPRLESWRRFLPQ